MKAVVLLALVAAANAYYVPLTYSYLPKTFVTPFSPVYHAESAGNVKNTVGLYKREAEADPLMFYSSGFRYPTVAYSGYSAYPYSYTPYSMYKPSVAAHTKTGVYANDATSSFNYAAKGRYLANSAGTIHKAKREAEPYYYGGYPYAVSAYAATPYTYGMYMPYRMKTYSNDAAKPFNYAAKGHYRAETAGTVHVAKREAEPYYYGAYPYGVSAYAATPYTYGMYMPYRMKTFSNDAAKPFNYAAKGHYRAETAGTVHVAKREAEPFYYNNFGYSSYMPTYTGFSTAGVYGYPYVY